MFLKPNSSLYIFESYTSLGCCKANPNNNCCLDYITRYKTPVRLCCRSSAACSSWILLINILADTLDTTSCCVTFLINLVDLEKASWA